MAQWLVFVIASAKKFLKLRPNVRQMFAGVSAIINCSTIYELQSIRLMQKKTYVKNGLWPPIRIQAVVFEFLDKRRRRIWLFSRLLQDSLEQPYWITHILVWSFKSFLTKILHLSFSIESRAYQNWYCPSWISHLHSNCLAESWCNKRSALSSGDSGCNLTLNYWEKIYLKISLCCYGNKNSQRPNQSQKFSAFLRDKFKLLDCVDGTDWTVSTIESTPRSLSTFFRIRVQQNIPFVDNPNRIEVVMASRKRK